MTLTSQLSQRLEEVTKTKAVWGSSSPSHFHCGKGCFHNTHSPKGTVPIRTTMIATAPRIITWSQISLVCSITVPLSEKDSLCEWKKMTWFLLQRVTKWTPAVMDVCSSLKLLTALPPQNLFFPSLHFVKPYNNPHLLQFLKWAKNWEMPLSPSPTSPLPKESTDSFFSVWKACSTLTNSSLSLTVSIFLPERNTHRPTKIIHANNLPD